MNTVELKKEAFFLATIASVVALYRYWRFYDDADKLSKLIYIAGLLSGIYAIISVFLKYKD